MQRIGEVMSRIQGRRASHTAFGAWYARTMLGIAVCGVIWGGTATVQAAIHDNVVQTTEARD